MRVRPRRRKSVAFFITLGACLVALAIALNVGWILLNWREVALLVFGIGLGLLVAPLTAVALRSLGERRAGIASGVNNATARLAGLLAAAAIPAAAGIGGAVQPRGAVLQSGFVKSTIISAVLCAIGAVVAALMIDAKKKRS